MREVRGRCERRPRSSNRGLHTGSRTSPTRRRNPGPCGRLALGVDAGVDVLAVEVGALVRRRDLHVDARMQRVEAREARDQPADGERRRQLEPQQALVGALLQLAGRVVDLVERAAQRAKVGGPLRRQRDAALRAQEQARAEPLLERADVAAHRALRHRQLARGARDAAVAGDGLEGADGVERREAAQHGLI